MKNDLNETRRELRSTGGEMGMSREKSNLACRYWTYRIIPFPPRRFAAVGTAGGFGLGHAGSVGDEAPNGKK